VKVETFTPSNVMKPIGPYSHIAKAGSFIAISGTAGVDPATGDFADLPKKQALLTMNLTAVTKD
jgi:enamine deaminase RidA (YjgF/YER057c/UK114 family)